MVRRKKLLRLLTLLLRLLLLLLLLLLTLLLRPLLLLLTLLLRPPLLLLTLLLRLLLRLKKRSNFFSSSKKADASRLFYCLPFPVQAFLC